MSKNSNSANEQTFVLEKTDRLLQNDGEPTTVTITRADKNENEKRLIAWKKYARVYGSNRQFVPVPLKMEEVFLTLKGCNIEDEDGTPLFKLPLGEESFYKSWNKLPYQIGDEIYEKVILMNPMWSSDKDSLFLRSMAPNSGDVHLRTVICPYCDYSQQVYDSPENEDFEIYNGELEDWEEDGLWFVVTCNHCGQPYKILSNHIESDNEANDDWDEEDIIDESEDDEHDFRFLDPASAPLSNDKTDFVYHYSDLGIKFAELKQFKKAEAAFRKVLVYDPENGEAYSWLGYILEEGNRLEEAEVAYRTAIKVQPGAEYNYSNLGLLLMKQGRFLEADTAFITGIKINPKEDAIYFNLGNSLMKQDRLKEAELVFRKLLEIVPNNEAARAKLNDILSPKK